MKATIIYGHVHLHRSLLICDFSIRNLPFNFGMIRCHCADKIEAINDSKGVRLPVSAFTSPIIANPWNKTDFNKSFVY